LPRPKKSPITKTAVVIVRHGGSEVALALLILERITRYPGKAAAKHIVDAPVTYESLSFSIKHDAKPIIPRETRAAMVMAAPPEREVCRRRNRLCMRDVEIDAPIGIIRVAGTCKK